MKKPDHPKLKPFLQIYRATGKQAEVTNKDTLWPLEAARAWTNCVGFFDKANPNPRK